MSAAVTTPRFKDNVHEALQRPAPAARAAARPTISSPSAPPPSARLPEFEALRDSARDIKNHTLAHLDLYLEAYERKVTESGGHVHYARDAAGGERDHPRPLQGARREGRDQGQVDDLRGDRPQRRARGGGHRGDRDRSRRIHHPAARRDALAHHRAGDPRHARRRRGRLPPRPSRPAGDRDLSQPEQLLAEARAILRDKFLSADVGDHRREFPHRRDRRPRSSSPTRATAISRRSCPRSTSSSPRWRRSCRRSNDAAQLLRVLARSATGQDMSVYTTLSTGPRRPGDPDGPEEYHVVLLDNGRSAMLGSEFEDMLRCIRCGACMNHCPVYHAVGGHAYGWVYPGPDGRGADAVADRRRRGRPIAQRLDLLRALRSGLPDAHSAAEDDAPLARARIRAPSFARRGALSGSASGRSSPSARRSIASRPIWRCARCISRAARAGASPGCRSPAAGPDTATCRRRRARLPEPMARQERERRNERARRNLRRRPPLAARDGRRGAAPRGGRGAPRGGPGGNHPARGQGDAAARVATFKAEAARAQASARRSRRGRRRSRRGRALPAREQSARDAAHGRGRAPRRHALGRDRARNLARALRRPRPQCGRASPSPAWRRRGTLALVSGPDNPTTLNFLPDNHIVVVFADDLVGDYESVFAQAARRLRRRRRAAHAQFHHRPVALGRHRADAAASARMGRGGCTSSSSAPPVRRAPQSSRRGDLVTIP